MNASSWSRHTKFWRKRQETKGNEWRFEVDENRILGCNKEISQVFVILRIYLQYGRNTSAHCFWSWHTTGSTHPRLVCNTGINTKVITVESFKVDDRWRFQWGAFQQLLGSFAWVHWFRTLILHRISWIWDFMRHIRCHQAMNYLQAFLWESSRDLPWMWVLQVHNSALTTTPRWSTESD